MEKVGHSLYKVGHNSLKVGHLAIIPTPFRQEYEIILRYYSETVQKFRIYYCFFENKRFFYENYLKLPHFISFLSKILISSSITIFVRVPVIHVLRH